MKALFTVIFIFSAVEIRAAPFVKIGETKLFMVSSKPERNGSTRIYLPLGETPEAWTKMLTVELHTNETHSEDYLINNWIQSSHPDSADSNLIRAGKAKSKILSYMTYPKKRSNPFDANWNLVRSVYKKDSGVFVYHYTVRVYSVETDIWNIVTTDRKTLFGPFGDATFEESE